MPISNNCGNNDNIVVHSVVTISIPALAKFGIACINPSIKIGSA